MIRPVKQLPRLVGEAERLVVVEQLHDMAGECIHIHNVCSASPLRHGHHALLAFLREASVGHVCLRSRNGSLHHTYFFRKKNNFLLHRTEHFFFPFIFCQKLKSQPITRMRMAWKPDKAPGRKREQKQRLAR